MHKNVSFDGGELNVNTFNNDEGWDCVVRIYNKSNGKNIATSRTYGKAKSFTLNVGTYDVEVKAMTVKGVKNQYTIENVAIKATEATKVEHRFESGILKLNTSVNGGGIDATVRIKANNNKSVATSRTYGKPIEFMLSPDTYEITTKALGEHKGKTKTITVVIPAKGVVEQVISF